MRAHTLDCGCKVDKDGRCAPLSMCPSHYIIWEACHASAVNERAAKKREAERDEAAAKPWRIDPP